MKKSKLYIIGIILFCIFFQRVSGLVNFFISSLDSNDKISFVLKKIDSAAAEEEEDTEESEKESKENEDKESEKEFNNLKHLNISICLSWALYSQLYYFSEDAEIFSQNFEIETPPPRLT